MFSCATQQLLLQRQQYEEEQRRAANVQSSSLFRSSTLVESQTSSHSSSKDTTIKDEWEEATEVKELPTPSCSIYVPSSAASSYSYSMLSTTDSSACSTSLLQQLDANMFDEDSAFDPELQTACGFINDDLREVNLQDIEQMCNSVPISSDFNALLVEEIKEIQVSSFAYQHEIHRFHEPSSFDDVDVAINTGVELGLDSISEEERVKRQRLSPTACRQQNYLAHLVQNNSANAAQQPHIPGPASQQRVTGATQQQRLVEMVPKQEVLATMHRGGPKRSLPPDNLSAPALAEWKKDRAKKDDHCNVEQRRRDKEKEDLRELLQVLRQCLPNHRDLKGMPTKSIIYRVAAKYIATLRANTQNHRAIDQRSQEDLMMRMLCYMQQLEAQLRACGISPSSINHSEDVLPNSQSFLAEIRLLWSPFTLPITIVKRESIAMEMPSSYASGATSNSNGFFESSSVSSTGLDLALEMSPFSGERPSVVDPFDGED